MNGEKKSIWKNAVYLTALVMFGLCYFVFSENQRLYAKQLEHAQSGYAEPAEEQEIPAQIQQGDETTEGIEKPANLPEGGDGSGEEDTAVADPGGEDMNATEEMIYQTVGDDYFADAVFIGDSRTVGMYKYGGLEEISTFYASTGLTVYKMFDARIVKTAEQKQKITIEEALTDRQFAKIYLMIGINEMGVGTVDSFIQKYKECVEHLQELQPDAIIYLQGIIKVSSARSAQGDYITNEGIAERNTEIQKLADGKQIFYLDVNPVICDETGGMIPEYSYDGVHLKARYIALWKDYLAEHAIVF